MDIIATSRPAPPGAGSLVDSAVEIAGRLGLAGRLSARPASVVDLALATGTHGPSLHRLLRALACVRLVDEVEPGVFALAQEGGEGQDGSSSPARSAFPMFGPDSLLYSVRTGQPAVRQLTVGPVFDFIASDPAA